MVKVLWIYQQSLTSDELWHYGVKGMKWGVRRDLAKARRKANAKTERLRASAKKKRAKAKKADELLKKRTQKRPITEIHRGLQENAFNKANKAKWRADKAEKKLAKWEKSVDELIGTQERKKKRADAWIAEEAKAGRGKMYEYDEFRTDIYGRPKKLSEYQRTELGNRMKDVTIGEIISYREALGQKPPSRESLEKMSRNKLEKEADRAMNDYEDHVDEEFGIVRKPKKK